MGPSGLGCIQLPKSHAAGATRPARSASGTGLMGKLGDACRARATECALTARAAGWRRDDELKAMYLTLAQQWLDIAEIGDEVDRQRSLEDLASQLGIL